VRSKRWNKREGEARLVAAGLAPNRHQAETTWRVHESRAEERLSITGRSKM
jgi:hypothetical protein